MAEQRPTLNEEAYRIIKIKEAAFTKDGTVLPSSFSIVYMGDTHVGMSACEKPPFEKPVVKYAQLLKKIISVNKGDILCIVHGGDATDHGEDNLKIFIDTTWDTLYTPYTDDNKKIPLFLNIGNHDYKLSKDVNMVTNGDLVAFNKLVAGTDLFKSDAKAPHPDVQVIPLNKLFLRVVLLNTGFGNRGDFGSINQGTFEREITQIDNWMTYLEGISKKIRFIIDMHIPPQIGTIGSGDTSHVLNDKYAGLFKRNILDQHFSSMISVVAHHRHCKPSSRYFDKGYNLNFFISPQGGNCDTACGGKCNQNCTGLKPYNAVKVNYLYIKNALTVNSQNPYEIISL